MGRIHSCVIAVGLLLGAAGCSMSKDPRKNLLEGTSGHAVYKLPPESLLETARHLLTDQGYELLPSSDPLYVKTTWKIDGNLDMGASWSRILVQAVRLDDGRVMVRAYRMSYTTNGRAASHPGTTAGSKDNKNTESGMGGSYVLGEPLSPTKPTLRRATDFEWALLARVEPRFAEHLKARVDAYLTEAPQPAETEAEAGIEAGDAPLPPAN